MLTPFYFQRVYGITTATVKVGYEYRNCAGSSLDHANSKLRSEDDEENLILWNIQTTKLSGHDMANTDLGNWQLDVQHKYNFHAGILQKGDGHTVYLKYKPMVMKHLS